MFPKIYIMYCQHIVHESICTAVATTMQKYILILQTGTLSFSGGTNVSENIHHVLSTHRARKHMHSCSNTNAKIHSNFTNRNFKFFGWH